jgi:hypothetical protein
MDPTAAVTPEGVLVVWKLQDEAPQNGPVGVGKRMIAPEDLEE